MSAFDPSAQGLPLAGSSGGSGLPEASGAGEVPVSDGAGTTYTATPQSDVVTAALVAMIGGEVEGSAIIADGAGDIRTVDANIAPVLAATTIAGARSALGSPATGSGTFAARPATCAVGDTYRVTSGARIGSIYLCTATDTWTLDAIDWIAAVGVQPTLAYDAEDLLAAAGGTVTTWRGRGSVRDDLGVLGAPGGTIAGLSGASSWGSVACAEWGDAATSPRLRGSVPGPLSTAARTVIAVVSSVSSTGSQIAVGWGAATAGGSAWNVGVRMAGSANTGMELYAAGATGTGATPTSDTPEVLSATYSGSQYALAQAAITDGVPSWSDSIAATTLAIVTGARDQDGPLTLGGYSAVGTSWPLKGRIHGVLVFPWVLSSDERNAVVNGLYARWF